MKKLLLTTFCVFYVFLAFGQKKTIGLYLKDLGAGNASSFTNKILPELDKNKDIKFVIVDPESYKDGKAFDYLVNITATPIKDQFDFYNEMRTETKSVTGDGGKITKVSKKVLHAGVRGSFAIKYYVRIMDVATQEYLFGAERTFYQVNPIEDKSVHAAYKTKRIDAQKAKLKVIMDKYQPKLEGYRASFYADFVSKTVLRLQTIPALIVQVFPRKKCKVLDKDIHVASIISGDFNSIEFARNKVIVNNHLMEIPNVKVYERQDTPDLTKMVKSEEFLNSENGFKNKDQLVGVDFLFVPSADYLDVINVETGVSTRQKLDQLKVDGSIRGSLTLMKKSLKSIVKPLTSYRISVSRAISEAVGSPSKIVEINKEKKGKAKHVIISSLATLRVYSKYKVYRIDVEKIGDEEIRREVEIGEIKTETTSCRSGAKVKKGGKNILQAFKDGKELIIKEK